MARNILPAPLRGIIPPLVTPLLDRDTLDEAGLERLVAHVLAGKVHGIFILGTTGEAPSLDTRLQFELIRKTCALVADRVPVLVGISDASCTESLKLAAQAHQHGAHALVLAPPYYFPAGQPELLEYLEHLVPQLPLPLYLYNMPFSPTPSFAADTVKKALDIPGIVGLKDSSNNMVYFHKLLEIFAARPTSSVLTGSEILLAESVLMGAHGGVCGGANLFPNLYVNLYKAASRGDLPRTLALHKQVLRVNNEIYGVGHYASSGLKGIKCALSCMGICHDFMADPFHRFRQEEHDTIQQHLRQLNFN